MIDRRSERSRPANAAKVRGVSDIPSRKLLAVPLVGALLIAGLGYSLEPARVALLAPQLLAVAGVLVVWTLGLAARGAVPVVRLILRRPHWVQALLHSSVYTHWALYWPEVGAHVPLIAAQVAFAYAFDGLLTFSRRRTWHLGFGHIPIIGSTNLFLWFHDDAYWLQFVMVAAIFLTKHFVRWKPAPVVPGAPGLGEPGEIPGWGHIFNPSAIGVSLAAVGLLAFGGNDLTWGGEISANLNMPPLMYHHLFLCGIVVQSLFGVALMTLSAAATLVVGSLVWFWATGTWFFVDTTIPIAVFLGFTLLMTDPVTSPRRPLGRVLHGTLYGVLVMVWYAVLGGMDGLGYYDKILPVPFLNLLAPSVDRWVGHLEGRLSMLLLSVRAARVGQVVGWAGFYGAMLATGAIGPLHPGLDPAFWAAACEAGKTGINEPCHVLRSLHERRCAHGAADACVSLGLTLADGHHVAPDPARALEFFAKACLLGDPAGCADAGFLYEQGRGVARDAALALRLYTQACDGGNAGGCRNLAVALRSGSLGVQSTQQAIDRLKRACTLGDAQSCARLKNLDPAER